MALRLGAPEAEGVDQGTAVVVVGAGTVEGGTVEVVGAIVVEVVGGGEVVLLEDGGAVALVEVVAGAGALGVTASRSAGVPTT